MAGKQFPFNVPNGSRYGAAMGRRNVGGARDDYFRLTMRKVPLCEGYDPGGTYWGSRCLGFILFCAWSPDRSVIRYGDARSYLLFEDQLRAEFPNADLL